MRHIALALVLAACGSTPCPEPRHAAMDEAPAAARARAIADGVAIRDALRAAAPTLEAVAAQLGTLTAAVSATPASVDYVAIDALASLEQPFTASAFASRSYLAFDPTTVDLLFHHYLTVIDLFQRIQRFAMSAAPQRRPELDRTAANLGATEQYGAVLTSVGGTVVAQLAFVEPVIDAAGAPTGRVRARPRRVGASIELDVFAGQPLDPSPRFVALIDGPSSRDVLGAQDGAFVDFVRELEDLNETAARVGVSQAELLTALERIAALDQAE